MQRKNEDGESGIVAVHCGANVPKIYPKRQNGIPQIMKWDTPKGEMGYHKRRNGIPQMAKWDTPNGKMGHSKRRFGASGHG